MACIQTFTYWFRSNLVWWKRWLSFTFWSCVTLVFIQGHSCIRNWKLVSIFFKILHLIRMKFSMWPQPLSLLKLMLNLFCTKNVQGRKLCWCDFYKITTVLCWHTCELICFKLRMVLSISILYSLISVRIVVMFTHFPVSMGEYGSSCFERRPVEVLFLSFLFSIWDCFIFFSFFHISFILSSYTFLCFTIVIIYYITSEIVSYFFSFIYISVILSSYTFLCFRIVIIYYITVI